MSIALGLLAVLKNGTLVKLKPDCDPFRYGIGIVVHLEDCSFQSVQCWVQFLRLPTPKWCMVKNLDIISIPNE